MNIPKTGQQGNVGVVVTKTLVVAGDPLVTTTPEHPRGAMLRAYDKQTGKEVGAVFMPARAERFADDLHGRRQAVHRRGGERRQLLGRVNRLQPAVHGAATDGESAVAEQDCRMAGLQDCRLPELQFCNSAILGRPLSRGRSLYQPNRLPCYDGP